MPDEIRRQALCADLARRHATLSLDALRLIDRWTLALQLHEQEHGPVDLQSLRRMIPRFDARRPVETAIGAALCAVGIELALEDEDRAELHETARAEMFAPVVCSTCGDTHLMTLGDRDVPCTRCPVPCQSCRAPGSGYCRTVRCHCVCHAERQAPVANPFPLLIQVAVPPVRLIDDDPIVVDEFALDQHRTRLSTRPAAIAQAEIEAREPGGEPYDELAVEWDLDKHAGEGT